MVVFGLCFLGGRVTGASPVVRGGEKSLVAGSHRSGWSQSLGAIWPPKPTEQLAVAGHQRKGRGEKRVSLFFVIFRGLVARSTWL